VEELPRYLSAVFGLNPSSQDTFIAGNSMGGYGAFKAALLHPQKYAAAASFSGVLSLDILRLLPDDPRRHEFTLLFGDLEKLSGGEHDPLAWLQQAARDPAALPRLFISTGRQEDIHPLSLMFHSACQSLGVAVDYHEEDAGHDWHFWDAQIKRFLKSVLTPPPG
jgi:S-formylglutathione hydrolase FrmB